MLAPCTSRGDRIALDWDLGRKWDEKWLKCHKWDVVTSSKYISLSKRFSICCIPIGKFPEI